MNSLGGFFTDLLFRWYDRWFRIRHGLYDSRNCFGSAVSMHVSSYRGRAFRIRGCAVTRGTKIGVVHLRNDLVGILGKREGQTGLASTAVLLRKEFVQSLSGIAEALLSRPNSKWGGIGALKGETILWREAMRLGFEVREMPGKTRRFLAGVNARAIVARTHPSGWIRAHELQRREVKEIWMSRETLLLRYGALTRIHPFLEKGSQQRGPQ